LKAGRYFASMGIALLKILLAASVECTALYAYRLHLKIYSSSSGLEFSDIFPHFYGFLLIGIYHSLLSNLSLSVHLNRFQTV